MAETKEDPKARIDFITFNFSGISENETRTQTPIQRSDQSTARQIHVGAAPTKNIAGCFNPNFVCVSRKKVGAEGVGNAGEWSPGNTRHGVQMPLYKYVEHYIGAVRSWESRNVDWDPQVNGSLGNWKTPATKADKDNLRAWGPCSLGTVFRRGYSDGAPGGGTINDTIRYIEFIVFKDKHENVLHVENSNQMGFCIDQHIVGGTGGDLHDKPLLKVPIGLSQTRYDEELPHVVFKSVGMACEDPRIWKLNKDNIGILTNWNWNIDRSYNDGTNYHLGPNEMLNFLKIFGINSLPVKENGAPIFKEPDSDNDKCREGNIARTTETAGITTYKNWPLNELRGGVDKGPLPVWSKIPFDFDMEKQRSIKEVLDRFYNKWRLDNHTMWVRDFELLCSSFYNYGKGKGNVGGCGPGDKNWAILPSTENNRIDILRGMGAFGTRPNKIYRHAFNKDAVDAEIMNVSCELVELRSQQRNLRTVSTKLDETFNWLGYCARRFRSGGRPCIDDDHERLLGVPSRQTIPWDYGKLRDSEKSTWEHDSQEKRYDVVVDNNPLEGFATMLEQRVGGAGKMFDEISVGGPMCNIIGDEEGHEKLGIAHIKVKGDHMSSNAELTYGDEPLFKQLQQFFRKIRSLRWKARQENVTHGKRRDWDNVDPNLGYIARNPTTSSSSLNHILGVDHGDIKSYIYSDTYMNMVYKYDSKSMVIKQISRPFFMNSYGALNAKQDTWLQFTSQIINCGKKSSKYCISYGEEDAMAKMVFIPKKVLHKFLDDGSQIYPTDERGHANYPATDRGINIDLVSWINDVRILTPLGFESIDIIRRRADGPPEKRTTISAAQKKRVRDSNNFLTCYGPGSDRVVNTLPIQYQGTYQTTYGPITLRGEGGDYPQPNSGRRGDMFDFEWSPGRQALTGGFFNSRGNFQGVFRFIFDGRGGFRGRGKGGNWDGAWDGDGGPDVVPEGGLRQAGETKVPFVLLRGLPTPTPGTQIAQQQQQQARNQQFIFGGLVPNDAPVTLENVVLPDEFTGLYNTIYGTVQLNRNAGVFTPVDEGRNTQQSGNITYHLIARVGVAGLSLTGEYNNSWRNFRGTFSFTWSNESRFAGWWQGGGGGGEWIGTRSYSGGRQKIEVQKEVYKKPKTKQQELQKVVYKKPKTKQPKLKKMNEKYIRLDPGARRDTSLGKYDSEEPPPSDIRVLLQKKFKLPKEFVFLGDPNTNWLYTMYTLKYVDQPKKAEEEARADWTEGVKRDYTLAEFHLWISTKYNLPPPWDGTKYAIDFEDVSINKDSIGKKNKHTTLKKKITPGKAAQAGQLKAKLADGGSKMKRKKKKKKRSTKRNKKKQNNKKKHRKTAKSKK